MGFLLLWIAAAALAADGIIQLFRGRIALGIILLIAACAVGPGGWSVLR